MVLEKFALLASDTARTKAYLQAMIREEKLPGICVVYSDRIPEMEEAAKQYEEDNEGYHCYFNIDIPILFLLQKMKIQSIFVCNKDINSDEMRAVLSKLDQKYLIYSGYGGYILKEHLFRF